MGMTLGVVLGYWGDMGHIIWDMSVASFGGIIWDMSGPSFGASSRIYLGHVWGNAGIRNITVYH